MQASSRTESWGCKLPMHCCRQLEGHTWQSGVEQLNAGVGVSRAEARASRPPAFPVSQSAMCH